MHHSHIGITRLVQSGFAINEQVYCYDTIRGKAYYCSITRLGTKNNYYDEDVENFLADTVETQFGLFYKDFCGTKDPERMCTILSKNTELVTQFFSFMYFRSIKTLELANGGSLVSIMCGDLDHSDFLRIQSMIKANPLQMLGDKYYFFPMINFSKTHFINNSLGFGAIIKNKRVESFFIPLSARIGILITNADDGKGNDFLYLSLARTIQQILLI